ncbi:MAG: PAS domain S-box protein [Bacteroidetes bacterium]|nr:PAS domain S-box protein [Bacteroidota bacterium]
MNGFSNIFGIKHINESNFNAFSYRNRGDFSVNQKLEKIINANGAATWEWEIQTGKTIFNEQWATQLGYSLTELGNYSFKTWKELVHPDDYPSVKLTLDNYLSGISKTYNTIYRLKHKDGTWVWIKDIGQIQSRDKFGNPKAMSGIHLKVTAREESKYKLVQSEERFRFAFHNSLASMFIIDPRTQQFEDVNNSALEFYGYTREEFLALNVTNLNTLSAQDIGNEIKKLIHDGKRKFVFQHRLSNGEIRDVEVFSSVIFTKNLPYLHSIIFDVTDRKRDQETLITSLEEISSYKFALDQAALVSMTDMEGIITFANDRLCEKVGYSQQELLGQNHRIIQSEFHTAQFYKELWDTVLSGKVWRGHVKNKTRYKKFWWADTTIVPFMNDSGQLYQIIAIRFDITKQKENEIVLEERNQFIETTINYLPIGICAIQLSTGLVTLTNPTFNAIFGWPKETIKYFDAIFELAFPDRTVKNELKSQLLRDVRSRKLENMQWNDIEIQTQNGSKRTIDVKSIPLFNQDLIITAITDITETNTAYEAVKKSNERFSYINKATNDAIFDWDIEKGYIYRGEGYTRIFGFDQTKNKLEDWLENIHPDDSTIVKNTLNEVLNDKKQSIWIKEYRLLSADSTFANVIETGYIVRNSRGKAVRMIGAIRDISELKKAELELNVSNTKLKEQTRELSLSNKELEQFAYIASHDLQEPLRMVSSFLSLLEKKYNSQIDEQGKKYIHFATDGAKRMRQIILDLLSYSRVGRTQSETIELNFNELIDEINQLNQSQFFDSNAEIHVGNLPTLLIPKSPMLQLFQNLFSNALKYRKHDSKPIIYINSIELETEWQFSVQDNGIGIEPEFYDKIFILFQRLHTRDKYEGTGVGLAICKKIVEQFGGKIWVESEPKIGSTFYFTLKKTT